MQDAPKKKFKVLPLVLILIVVFFSLGIALFRNIFKEEISVQEDMAEKNYYSTLLKSESLISDWKPGEDISVEGQPEVSGESAILVDINSGKVVIEKNSNEKMKIASLVKIMTALVALEHKNLDEEVLITYRASDIGENTMALSQGEVYTLEELLYGLILNSGNDAAYAIAEGVAGNVETFVKWMNMKAKELNLNNTEIFDPSGLNDETYSTAVDLVKLARYAMQNEDFRKIVGTFSMELPYSEKHKYLYLENQTNLLTTYPGVGGIKTGYTEEAGLCLVTYAKNDGIELVGVVLNAVNRKFDMIIMLDYGFKNYGIEIEHGYEY